MERINILLDKIRDLNKSPNVSPIEVDLMMDYTKVLYADLIEWKKKLGFSESLTAPYKEEHAAQAPQKPVQEMPPAPAEAPAEPPVPQKEPNKIPAFTHVFTAPESTGKDIRTQIGINDKYQYISELFGNDRDAYEEVIRELNSFEKEHEAKEWLYKTIHHQYNWNEENETLQLFQKMLNDFYNG